MSNSLFAKRSQRINIPQREQKPPRSHLRANAMSVLIPILLFLTACSDFISPVKSTPEPTEYSFNYWLLQRQYLYEDELSNLAEDGDSVQTLYNTLKDPYTTYTPPSKSEIVGQQIRTSIIIGGDIGLRYSNHTEKDHPIYISRVYPKGPAGRANVPKNGNIISVNDYELIGANAKAIYDSIVSTNKNIDLRIAYKGDTTLYKLVKETIYAPTIFVDTLFSDTANGYPGLVFINIEIFKDTTEDRKNGSLGELKAYLDSTASDNRVRVLDLRGNPGGSVKQCINMADLFVKEGNLSTNIWRSMDENGVSKKYSRTYKAKAGDPGEHGHYLILANGGSASCAEIFIAAVTETTNIPFVGTKTYGKGIGQTSFYTYAGGLAKITDREFLTPRDKSYHIEGIHPKYVCQGTVYEYCAAIVANKLYGVKIPTQDGSLAKSAPDSLENSVLDFEGGSIEWADSDYYFKAFEKQLP